MNVLIVNPIARPDPRGYSCWNNDVAQYAATLLAAGHAVQVYTTRGYDEKELVNTAQVFTPKLILIHTMSRQSDQARAIGAFFARSLKNVVVMFCGPHAGAWPADCMNVAHKVFVMRGPADHLLAPLAQAIATTGDFFSLPGLSFPVLNRFYHNHIDPPPALESAPMPDRQLTQYAQAIAPLADSLGAEIETSRGDYHVCDRTQACFDTTEPKTGVLPQFQRRTVSHVIDEARQLAAMLPGLGFLGLRDEACMADPDWTAELCAAWPRHVGLPFWIAARPEFLGEGIFEALAAAGCFRVHLSVESGSDHVRRRVIGRQVADSRLLYVARACRRYRMALITVNEIGFPGETEDMILETIDLNRRIRPDWALCSVFHPEPGTALFQRAEAKGWLTPSAYGVFYDPETRIEQPWIRTRKIDAYLRTFTQRVFSDMNAPVRV